jgi:acyl carrier protein
VDIATFLAKVAEVLDYDREIVRGQNLEDIDVWDSLGILSIVELLEELGADVDIDTINNLKTTDELIALAGRAVND